jgi:hypothetical protein
MRGHQRGSQRTQQQRHQASLRARPLHRRPQPQQTIPQGGRRDPKLRVACRQPGGSARGRCDQATRPQRPKQQGKHQEHPGGLLPPVHPHRRLTVLDPPANAKITSSATRGNSWLDTDGVEGPAGSAGGMDGRVVVVGG